MFNKFAKSLQDKTFKIRPEWGFSPAPSLKQSVPIISDNLVDALESGKIKPVPAIHRLNAKNTVELTNGASITVDCIIWCTGYRADFSIVEDEYDPTRDTTSTWKASPGSNGKPLPRLYQNIFSLKEPQSLAYLGAAAFPSPAFQLYDLASMAVAQVWKGTSSLPSKDEMAKTVDEHHKWVCGLAQRGSVYPGIVKPGPWMTWVNDTAGTGVNDMLGYGIAGWSFWYREREFCKILMDGIYSPHIYRLFDGKRKKWDLAKEAILKANKSEA
jgi:dimethylaniline monooxygenase (N-oxide forming)